MSCSYTTTRERIQRIRRVTVPNAAMPPEFRPNHHHHHHQHRRILDGTVVRQQEIQHFWTLWTHKSSFPRSLDRPREGHPTYTVTPGPLSEGRGGGIFIPPCIARRASLSRHVLVPNLALVSLFHAATATALRKLSIRRSLGGRRTPRRLWNRGLLARHKAGRGVQVQVGTKFSLKLNLEQYF